MKYLLANVNNTGILVEELDNKLKPNISPRDLDDYTEKMNIFRTDLRKMASKASAMYVAEFNDNMKHTYKQIFCKEWNKDDTFASQISAILLDLDDQLVYLEPENYNLFNELIYKYLQI